MKNDIYEISKKWICFIERMKAEGKEPLELLPKMLFVGNSALQTEQAARELSDILYQQKVMEFEGNVQMLSYKIGYSPATDQKFMEIRKLAYELQNHYRGPFKGCLLLDITDWTEHAGEMYFEILMSYLADIQKEVFPLFCINTKDAKKAEKLISHMQKYFRVEMVDFLKTDEGLYLQYALQMFQEKEIILQEMADEKMSECIRKVKEDKSFTGYETIQRLAEAIIFEYYLNSEKGHPLTGMFLQEFMETSGFMKQFKHSCEKVKNTIGFQIGR